MLGFDSGVWLAVLVLLVLGVWVFGYVRCLVFAIRVCVWLS